MSNRLQQLSAAGTVVWLDFLDRGFLAEGGLRKLIDEDGLTGVTSNPAIFEKAMGGGNAYDAGFAAALAGAEPSPIDIYEREAIADIRAAADDLQPVYDRLHGRDGYVSLEVSPYLANDTDGTVAEARRLWAAVNRPNLMIKVPGTEAGVPAIRQLLGEGLNINVTLLFAQDAYEAVALAHVAALEARVARGEPIERIASVASFFVSRIDSQIDKAIDERVSAGDPESATLKALRGKVAIANAKLAYAWWQELVESDRWQQLAVKHAMPQRLLWASTGVKDKAYPETLYVDTLIGPETVNTMPVPTMDAFRRTGTVTQSLTSDVDGARIILAEAQRLGLDLTRVTDELTIHGVKKFADSFDDLLKAVAMKRAQLLAEKGAAHA
ncbi:MAG: transaldolase [Novosphingobium sp.]